MVDSFLPPQREKSEASLPFHGRRKDPSDTVLVEGSNWGGGILEMPEVPVDVLERVEYEEVVVVFLLQGERRVPLQGRVPSLRRDQPFPLPLSRKRGRLSPSLPKKGGPSFFFEVDEAKSFCRAIKTPQAPVSPNCLFFFLLVPVT